MSAEEPQARRMTDMPTDDTKLILYQLGELKTGLGELKSDVRAGFSQSEARIGHMELRLQSLERTRAADEAAAEAAAKNSTKVSGIWIPILLTVVVIVGGIITALAQSH